MKYRAIQAILLITLCQLSPAKDTARPNILVILADDLGIESLSSYGGASHKTPNLDKLASQGMRFTNCFSNPTCSPSRATLLTGRYSFLHGMKEVIWDPKKHSKSFVNPATQPSFARQLKSAGYATAIAGKWQLSFLHQRDQINAFGFDQYQCWQIFDAKEQRTTRFHKPHFNRNGKVIANEIADQYGPDVDVDFLVDFIKASHAEEKPFLAYHTSLLPHFPWVPTPDSKDQSYRPESNDNTQKGDPGFFPDMVTYLDKCVGRLLTELEELGIADNTIVIFLADNGTDISLSNELKNGKTVNGGKGTMTDRGTHVPLIVRWPGMIEAGSTCEDLIDFSDMLPTLCELANASLPEQKIHGRSFAPQLLGKPGESREWVHIQNKNQRYLRTKEYILDSNGQFRPVIELWNDPAKPLSEELSKEAQAGRRELKKVFEQLGN